MIDRYNLIFSLYLGQVDAVQVQHISLANNITYLPRLLQEMDEIAAFFFFIYYQPQYKSAISAAELAKKKGCQYGHFGRLKTIELHTCKAESR